MIKRLIGIVVALAVIGIIVLTAMRYGDYRSMLPRQLISEPSPVESVEQQVVSPPAVVERPDSVVRHVSDSL